jgi:cytidine deaminase
LDIAADILMGVDTIELSDDRWEELARTAWEVRRCAHVHGPTKVGAAALSAAGSIFAGCNVEHRFRSHDVHAEVNALTSMVAAGHGAVVALVIASERDRFTPCGACLDWIFELGGPDCLVAFQGAPNARIAAMRADQLMPHYPR